MPQFLIPGSHTGLLVRGNIDLDGRKYPLVFNKNGTISSVKSASFGFDSSEDTGNIRIPNTVRASVKTLEILVPTVVHSGGKWRIVGDSGAIDFALSTGRHLGVFDTPAHASSYAIRLHNYLAQFTDKILRQQRQRRARKKR